MGGNRVYQDLSRPLSQKPLPLLCVATIPLVRSTQMKSDSNLPNVAPLGDATGLSCLADSDNYRRLDDRRRFFVQNQYSLAVAPFFLAIVFGLGILPRIVPDTAFWAGVAETLIVGSLVWAGIVIFHALFVYLRWFLYRCPRCGWRFGPGDRCGSCDLPRSRDNLTPSDSM